MSFRARFIPRHPEKYVGDASDIWIRSSWEKRVMEYFDGHPEVLSWGSEEIIIPYINPEDNQVHRYFPDFFALYVDKAGQQHKMVFEIKPLHEADDKKAKSEHSKNRLAVNKAKWESAEIYCASRGWGFRVLTEQQLFYQGKAKSDKLQVLAKKSG